MITNYCRPVNKKRYGAYPFPSLPPSADRGLLPGKPQRDLTGSSDASGTTKLSGLVIAYYREVPVIRTPDNPTR